MRFALRWVVLVGVLTVVAGACSGETAVVAATCGPVAASRADVSATTTLPAEFPNTLIPISEPGFAPVLSGRWLQSRLGLDGLSVTPRDLIWDSDHFYLMLCVGSGDVRIWRSVDAIEWEELPQLGTASTTDGPSVLLSHGDRLVAGGDRDGQATVWIYGGESPWREVSLGVSATITDLAVAGSNLVAFGTSPHYTEGAGVAPPPRHATIWVSSGGESWTEVAGVDLFGDYSYAVGMAPSGGNVFAFANRGDGSAGVDRHPPLITTSSDGINWKALDVDLGVVTLTNITGDRGIVLFASDSIWRSNDGQSWTRLIIDRSGLDGDGRSSVIGLFNNRLVAIGGILDTDEHLGEVDFAAASTYVGDGQWQPLGQTVNVSGPGLIGVIVPGGDRFVAYGTAATQGSPNNGWGLFTFVLEFPVEDVIPNWPNLAGLGQVDPDVWAERLDRACAEGVWEDDVAWRLADEFIAEDLPYSVRADGTIPETGEAAQALWLMAVNYCRADFPAGEIADGAPTP